MHDLVSDALSAIRQQDWPKATALLDQATVEGMDESLLAELLSIRAAAKRRQGYLDDARLDYQKLHALVGEDDPRAVEAYEGLAECYFTAGAVDLATQLIERALELAPAGSTLKVRCETVYARCIARSDLPRARARMEQLFQSQLSDGSARANARFYYGDILLAQGELIEARQQYGIAHAEAEVYGAPKTAADCLRREATVHLALGERQNISEALEMLQDAQELYEHINDRALCMVFAERGEIFKHTGIAISAHSDLRRATLYAREGNEGLRVAHGLLAQADLFRVTKTWKRCLALLTEAEIRYQKLGHAWGLVMCAAVDALLQRQVGNEDAAARATARCRALVAEAPNAVGALEHVLAQELDSCDPLAPLMLVFPD